MRAAPNEAWPVALSAPTSSTLKAPSSAVIGGVVSPGRAMAWCLTFSVRCQVLHAISEPPLARTTARPTAHARRRAGQIVRPRPTA